MINIAVHTKIHVFDVPLYAEMTTMVYVEVLRSLGGIFPTSIFECIPPNCESCSGTNPINPSIVGEWFYFTSRLVVRRRVRTTLQRNWLHNSYEADIIFFEMGSLNPASK
jgi:hypothetical protein